MATSKICSPLFHQGFKDQLSSGFGEKHFIVLPLRDNRFGSLEGEILRQGGELRPLLSFIDRHSHLKCSRPRDRNIVTDVSHSLTPAGETSLVISLCGGGTSLFN